MCTPRKPVNVAAALAALTSIADSLSVDGSSGASLESIAENGRTWTRSVKRIEILNIGTVAESRCAAPRTEE